MHRQVIKKYKSVKEMITRLNSDDYRNLLNLVYTDWNVSDIEFSQEVIDEYEPKYRAFFNKLLTEYVTALYVDIKVTKKEDLFDLKEEIKRLKDAYNVNNMISLMKNLEVYEGLGFINQIANKFHRDILKEI